MQGKELVLVNKDMRYEMPDGLLAVITMTNLAGVATAVSNHTCGKQNLD